MPFLREKPAASMTGGLGNIFHRCWAQAPPPEFLQFCCNIQALFPKVWLYRACAEVPAAEHSPFALQVDDVPKLKLHLSAFSWPLESNQAFRSGSEMASSNSWDITFAMPSAPPTPVAGLFGPVVWISQPLGQRSGLPTNAYLMSTPPRDACVCQPQYCVQNPEVSLPPEDVSTK